MYKGCGGVRIRIVEVYFGVSDQNLYGNTPPETPPVYRPTVTSKSIPSKTSHV